MERNSNCFAELVVLQNMPPKPALSDTLKMDWKRIFGRFSSLNPQPKLQVDVYSIPDISLPHNSFYPEAAAKLILDTLLPEVIKTVLYLDTDILLIGDICPSVPVFRLMNDTIFGFAPEMSSWYAYEPAVIGNWSSTTESVNKISHNYFYESPYVGFNSGAIFWNLQLARKAQWSQSWSMQLTESMVKHTVDNLRLGDQDVFNLFCQDNASLCTMVSHDWNYQLVDNVRRSKHPLHNCCCCSRGMTGYLLTEKDALPQDMLNLWMAFSIRAADELSLECDRKHNAKITFEVSYSNL